MWLILVKKLKGVLSVNCPVCNERLQITYRYDIEIDYCPKCRGVWLDKGELDKIIEFAKNYSNYSSSKNPYIQDNQKIDNYKSKQYFDEYYSNPKYDYNKKYEDKHYYKYKKKKKYKNFLEELFDIF